MKRGEKVVKKGVKKETRKLVLTFKLPPRIAKCVKEAISVETKERLSHSKAVLSEKNGLITLTIQSTDTSSLRAAANSYLRWIDIAITTYRDAIGRM